MCKFGLASKAAGVAIIGTYIHGFANLQRSHPVGDPLWVDSSSKKNVRKKSRWKMEMQFILDFRDSAVISLHKQAPYEGY